MLRGGHSVVSQIVEDKLSQTVGIILAGLSKSENFVDDDPGHRVFDITLKQQRVVPSLGW
jgi:hypothetical protein